MSRAVRLGSTSLSVCVEPTAGRPTAPECWSWSALSGSGSCGDRPIQGRVCAPAAGGGSLSGAKGLASSRSQGMAILRRAVNPTGRVRVTIGHSALRWGSNRRMEGLPVGRGAAMTQRVDKVSEAKSGIT